MCAYLCIREPSPNELVRTYWSPGQTIPVLSPRSVQVSTPESTTPPISVKIMDSLQALQASMERKLTAIDDKLASIDERTDKLEAQQAGFEKQAKVSTPKPGSSTPNRRKRLTPTSLQVIKASSNNYNYRFHLQILLTVF